MTVPSPVTIFLSLSVPELKGNTHTVVFTPSITTTRQTEICRQRQMIEELEEIGGVQLLDGFLWNRSIIGSKDIVKDAAYACACAYMCACSGTMLPAMKGKKQKEKWKVGPKTTAFLTVCRLTVMSRRHVLMFNIYKNFSAHIYLSVDYPLYIKLQIHKHLYTV